MYKLKLTFELKYVMFEIENIVNLRVKKQYISLCIRIYT